MREVFDVKKLLALLAAGFMMVLAVGFGAAEAAVSGKHIGISMPTTDNARWVREGLDMKTKLEALGCVVTLQYADSNVNTQISQIESMIDDGVNCVVVTAVDNGTLVNVLGRAKSSGIPVIAYDRLPMNTDSVLYYVTFDNRAVGKAIGRYVEEKLALSEGKGPYSIEFFAGSPYDNNALFVNLGVSEVLGKYVENGRLTVPSGRSSFDETAILHWSREYAQRRMENILSNFYEKGKTPSVVITPSDGMARGVIAALEKAGAKPGKDWPVITGQDADIAAVKDIIAGKQAMTVFKDFRVLADKCVALVTAVVDGKKPEINDTDSYDNRRIIVPAYLCEVQEVDISNLEKVLVDSGYYTKAELGLQ